MNKKQNNHARAFFLVHPSPLTPPTMPRVHCDPVLQNTLESAVSRPDSAALSRPDFPSMAAPVRCSGAPRFMGGMGQTARLAAWLIPCFEHPAHPLPLQNGTRVVHQSSIRSLTVTATPTGHTGPKATPGRYIPRHYVKRVARFLVLRAAVRQRQRQRQPLNLPATLRPRSVLSLPGQPSHSASQPTLGQHKGAEA